MLVHGLMCTVNTMRPLEYVLVALFLAGLAFSIVVGATNQIGTLCGSRGGMCEIAVLIAPYMLPLLLAVCYGGMRTGEAHGAVYTEP